METSLIAPGINERNASYAFHLYQNKLVDTHAYFKMHCILLKFDSTDFNRKFDSDHWKREERLTICFTGASWSNISATSKFVPVENVLTFIQSDRHRSSVTPPRRVSAAGGSGRGFLPKSWKTGSSRKSSRAPPHSAAVMEHIGPQIKSKRDLPKQKVDNLCR